MSFAVAAIGVGVGVAKLFGASKRKKAAKKEAQTMANQGSDDAAKSGAMIGDQEAANQKASAEGATAVQTAKVAGADAARGLKYKKTNKLMGMAAGAKSAADANVAQAGKDQMNAIGGIATSAIGLSDRKFKKNITKIGQSNSGLNIYSFEYKNPVHGKGLFQGVMADEAPLEAVVKMNSYNAVNYDMIDVEFKNI